MSNVSGKLVFISYTTKSEKVWLRDLENALSHHGLRPWLGDRDVMPGESLEKKLEEALRKSDAILFILTGDVSERPNVFFELGFAKALGKQSIFIVPNNQEISWIPTGLRDEEIVTQKSPKETALAIVAALRSDTPTESSTSQNGDDEPSTDKDIDFLDEIGFAQNPERRFPFILLLDTSGSMAGQPITELNTAIFAFMHSLVQDETACSQIDLSIISFGDSVHIDKDFSSPITTWRIHFEARGATVMGQALQNALEMLSKRKAFYKKNGIPYYRPWIFLITDGSPTDNWQEVAQRVREGQESNKFSFFAVGVENADMETLSLISSPRTPRKLRELDFRSLFSWLSHSITEVTRSLIGEQIGLPPIDWSSDI